MAESKVLIAVAVIGVVGTIGAAVISNFDKLFPKAPAAPQTPNLPAATPGVAHPTPVSRERPPPEKKRFTGPMGPLEAGISYNQGDLYDRPASSPQECATLCYNDDRCVAMTFITSQQRCWLKSSVGPVGRSNDMVSSRKAI